MAAIADFLYSHKANILHADQHQDADQALFLMRVEWELEGFDLDLAEFPRHFAPIAERNQMRWRLELQRPPPAPGDLRFALRSLPGGSALPPRSGELNCEIPLVIGNHPDAAQVVEFYGIPFHHIPVDKDSKADAEKRQLELLEAHGIDLVVLARYMQVLSAGFVERYPERIINVHHSFLPAFSGARPYQRAFERGVKLIGATSHFVTAVWTTARSSSRT